MPTESGHRIRIVKARTQMFVRTLLPSTRIVRRWGLFVTDFEVPRVESDLVVIVRDCPELVADDCVLRFLLLRWHCWCGPWRLRGWPRLWQLWSGTQVRSPTGLRWTAWPRRSQMSPLSRVFGSISAIRTQPVVVGSVGAIDTDEPPVRLTTTRHRNDVM
jgi:hypothetical protein